MNAAPHPRLTPGGSRPAIPEPGALLSWPEGFGTRFTVFVDTEEEFDWTKPLARENRSTEAMRALPQMHALFADHGVGPAYMIDHPIATCAMSVDVLTSILADGRSAIGSQLHPWVNPPHDEPVTPFNSFVGNLPRDLEAAKLTALTEAITQAFGRRPVMMRTGRYGIGPNSLELLAAEGYRVDSSMRSGYDYTQEGGPDFSRIGNHAFRTGMGDLVELPLTTVYTGALGKGGAGLYRALGRLPKGRGVTSRLGLMTKVALTPEDMPIGDALEAIRVAVGEGVRLLMFSYHSPSAAPGYTPYVRDAGELRAFREWWVRAFALLAQLNVATASHDDILAALDAAG
ncbi:WalW protein [Sphingomonas turrisvirgatae]|uniref:WalW protein n=1 Tax=Sphingomonas turrisvirgatae TaxID=1888892 RepID=UPI000A9118CA|nr:WalW protein [Sphingomonas turrisvirgatae]